MKLTLKAATLAVLTGCAACTAPALPEAQRIDGIDWLLTEVNGLPWGHDASLYLERDRLTGVGPCNAYSGQRDGTAPAFRASALNATRLACRDPARMAAETEYLAMLPHANAIRRDHGKLVLSGPGLIMVFDKREARGDDIF